MKQPNYRFSFSITDETTGDALVVDFCSFTKADQFGGCETVDHQVARGLRAFERLREKHEIENYPDNDKQLVTQTAAKIRAVAEG